MIEWGIPLVIGLVVYGVAFALFVLYTEWRDSRRWRAAFRRAFTEWSETCDWQGYSEIPDTMYENLVWRLEQTIIDGTAAIVWLGAPRRRGGEA